MISILFQTILVAIDESHASEKALAALKTLAKALSAKLIVAHVLDPYNRRSLQPLYSYSQSESLSIDENLREEYEREWVNFVSYYKSLLERKVDEAIAAGIGNRLYSAQWLSWINTLRSSKTAHASLIVVGSHQRRGMAEIMLGSTSNYITHYAPCSVIVVCASGAEEELVLDANKMTADIDISVV